MDDRLASPYSGSTASARNLTTPVRDFLSTETGSASVLLLATVGALAWANSPWFHSYESVWTTTLSIRLGSRGISTDLRHWINEGLMTFFFLVVGLEAKRELDIGALRQRQRLVSIVVAAIGGMTVPIGIYMAFNAGTAGGHGWGAAMATDTAFALGALALITPRSATRVRVFLLTLAIADDLGALVVIAIFYSRHVSVVALLVALGLFVALVALEYAPAWRAPFIVMVGVALWVALFESGIDPVITGLAIGLLTRAHSPARADLERATALARSFREQPTAELARSAQLSVASAISANERIQYSLHPWTSFLIVPVFALANAGIHVTGSLLGKAVTSPITLGIVVGYVAGKPLGIVAASWLVSRPMLRGPRPFLSWPALAGAGAVAGIGFTVSLLVCSLAFAGQLLDEARLGVLAAVIVAPLVASVIFALLRRLPPTVRARQIGATG
ncbi:MAG TPA: Na+/H+ antiporter NhaA, partial [Acidimicrobiales bacterium]|nr:Na+/H+ antiporter NhaA [Acidimicrobiales bacterium]